MFFNVFYLQINGFNIYGFNHWKKRMTIKDIFRGLSSTLSFNFQDFPEPKWFSRTFQALEFQEKNPGLSRRRHHHYY